MKYESTILKRLIDTYGVVGNPHYISEIIKEFIVQGKERFPELFTYQADWLAHIDEFGLNPTYTVSYTGQSIYAPNTLESPVKSAILKGSTKYRDIDTGEVLDAFEDGRNLELVSVKMPVLTTTGKNLLNEKIIVADWGSNNNNVCRAYVEEDTQYIYTSSPYTGYVAMRFYDKNGTEISRDVAIKNGDVFTTPQGCAYLDTHISNISNVQIEKGAVATPYEPYKSNILTVNEDVTLRGIGEVQDTLDCLTGELTQRVGEVVLDGSEDWRKNDIYPGTTGSRFVLRIENIKQMAYGKILCNKMQEKSDVASWQTEGEYISADEANISHINIRKTQDMTLEEFKEWLSQNPITVQYQLTESTVKTVDLTIHDKDHQKVERLTTFEGGTHFTTSSQDGSLLPTLTVDVVTDLEETLMVCSLEGNTM